MTTLASTTSGTRPLPAGLMPYHEPQHQPFDLGSGRRVAMLIHGFPGTPAEVRGLGEALAESGWRAVGPLLPGFGTDIANLAGMTRHDWLDAVRQRWQALRAEADETLLVGNSMGGALALHLAADLPPDRILLIAPFWRAAGWMPRLVPFAKHVMAGWTPFKNANFDDPQFRERFASMMPGADLDDPEVRDWVRHEMRLPLFALDEVFKLGRAAWQLAPQVTAPALVVQGTRDELVVPAATRRLVRRLNRAAVDYVELDGDHELIHDFAETRQQVIDHLLAFANHTNGYRPQ